MDINITLKALYLNDDDRTPLYAHTVIATRKPRSSVRPLALSNFSFLLLALLPFSSYSRCACCCISRCFSVALLCCALLCFAVLCCVLLYFAALCCVLLCCAVLCFALRCYHSLVCFEANPSVWRFDFCENVVRRGRSSN